MWRPSTDTGNTKIKLTAVLRKQSDKTMTIQPLENNILREEDIEL